MPNSDPTARRAQLIAEALKQRIPLAAYDPTAIPAQTLDAAARALIAGFPNTPNVEQSGLIYQNKDGSYGYSIPVTQNESKGFALRAAADPDHKFVAIVHTHPTDDPASQVFSPNDVTVANQLKVPSYIQFLADGSIRKYIPGQTATKDYTLPNTRFSSGKTAIGDSLTDLANALISANNPSNPQDNTT
jgi:hypothetical protein